ncbi:MAG: flagellar basal body-associated FliL family protein [Pseudomonadota bacterium]
MSDTTADEQEPRKKGGLLPLVLGLALAVAGAGGGYVVTSSGLLSGTEKTDTKAKTEMVKAAFVPLDPLVISVGGEGRQRHLRFNAQLEVSPGNERSVQDVLPRVMDVLNGYLRAISLSDIEDPAALVRMRAQMLRRVQIIVGEGVVNDLLVMEFVLS